VTSTLIYRPVKYFAQTVLQYGHSFQTVSPLTDIYFFQLTSFRVGVICPRVVPRVFTRKRVPDIRMIPDSCGTRSVTLEEGSPGSAGLIDKNSREFPSSGTSASVPVRPRMPSSTSDHLLQRSDSLPTQHGAVESLQRVMSRLDDLSIHSFSRLIFRLGHASKRTPLDSVMVDRLVKRATILLSSAHDPHVIPQLSVGFALLGSTIAEHRDLWETLISMTRSSLPTMEADQLQQVAFSLGRAGIGPKDELVDLLFNRSIFLSPVSSGRTYVNLLVSLDKLLLSTTSESFEMFKKMFLDHIGVRGYPDVRKLEVGIKGVLGWHGVGQGDLKRLRGILGDRMTHR
jgi:hypothetical protein